MFHREYECYLSAEGSFAEDSPVIEDGKPHTPHTTHTLTLTPTQCTAGSVTVIEGVSKIPQHQLMFIGSSRRSLTLVVVSPCAGVSVAASSTYPHASTYQSLTSLMEAIL